MYSQPSIASHTAPAIWVLVADERHAQIYSRQRVEKTIPLIGNSKRHQFTEQVVHELVAVPGMKFEAEPAKDFQVGRHQLGRVFESASPAHHMSEPHISVQELVIQHFVKDIAEKLHAAHEKNAYGKLVLVAGPKLLGKLRAALGGAVHDSVIAELPKDMMHSSGAKLAEELEAVLPLQA